MPFNSLYFAIFMLFVVGGYWALGSWRARKLFLLGASWFFYATWSPRFLLVLIATTWVDFHLAHVIYRRRWNDDGTERPGGRARARGLLALSLVMNLGLLAVFKYSAFLYDGAASVFGLGPMPRALALVLPLGISFYTFHSISYVVDTYRGLRPPTASFPDFALYVAFFPQLIAGPITRWGFFGPQLDRPRRVDLDGVEAALFLVATGLIKKVVCADSLGAFVDVIYDPLSRPAQIETWLAFYAYAFQIYFDFSGYTDMAWGLAGLLGFRLPVNFRHPYLAENPREFWQRWHVSLSTWLRDYLYVGLGGNRRGALRTHANLIVTMVLGGLWHGAAWTFVLWGAYHGVWLSLHRLVSGRPPETPAWLRRLVTFHLVSIGWVLFRSPTLAMAGSVLGGLFVPHPLDGGLPIAPIALVLAGVATHALSLRVDLRDVWRSVPRVAQGMVYGVVVIAIGLFGAQTQRFIYFQF